MENNFYEEYSDNNYQSRTISETAICFVKAYGWMFLASFITFLSASILSRVLESVIDTQDVGGMTFFLFAFVFCMIGELILCFVINKNALKKANFVKAAIGLLFYSIFNGVTFSFLFIYFDTKVLYQVFGCVSGYFLILSGLTYLFKNKIQKLRGFAFVGLLALLLTTIFVSIYSLFFFASEEITTGLFLMISILGILVFSIQSMVDIKSMYDLIEYSQHKNAASIAAAFTLYLDFVQILIYILRILAASGKGRKR